MCEKPLLELVEFFPGAVELEVQVDDVLEQGGEKGRPAAFPADGLGDAALARCDVESELACRRDAASVQSGQFGTELVRIGDAIAAHVDELGQEKVRVRVLGPILAPGVRLGHETRHRLVEFGHGVELAFHQNAAVVFGCAFEKESRLGSIG